LKGSKNKLPGRLKAFQEEHSLIDLGNFNNKDRKPATTVPSEESSLATGHKLFFLVYWMEASFYGEAKSFKIRPCAQYIKKDGTAGRILQMVKEDTPLLASKEEKDLHRLISSMPSGDDLLTLLPEVEECPEIDLRYRQEGTIHPLHLEKLDKIQMEWVPAELEPQLLFRPRFKFNDSEFMECEDFFWHHNYRQALFTPVHSQGVIYSLDSCPSDLNFLEEQIQEGEAISGKKLNLLLKKPCPDFLEMTRLEGKIEYRKILPRPRFMIKTDQKQLELWIYLLYGGAEASLSSPQDFLTDIAPEGKTRTLYHRDRRAELTLIHHCLHMAGSLRFLQEPILLDLSIEEFIARYSESISQCRGEIFLKEKKQPIFTQPMDFKLTSGIDWLDIKLSLAGKPVSIPHDLPASGLIPYQGGFKLLSGEEMQKLKLLLARGTQTKEGIRTSLRDIKVLEMMEEDIRRKETKGLLTEHLKALKDYKGDFTDISRDVPKGLKATLRPYQQKGIQWLRFLYTYRLGGILADDMGLGKTLQAIALMLHAREQDNRQPFMVCAPLSTLKNWSREIERFAPGLRPEIYHGANRSLDSSEPDRVHLTTYHTLIRDIKSLNACSWDIVFLDESQVLKNYRSQSYQAVESLKTEQYITLSGTPVENHIDELWAAMNLINPGLLGERKSFLDRYNKIMNEGRNDLIQELKERIRPFILRRTKQQVARDLPSREEIALSVELSPGERQFYQRQKDAFTAEILKMKGQGAKAFEISSALLQALNSLRQIAISPALRGGPDRSSKLDLAVEKIEEARSEDHKVLVFSQYTRVLEILKQRLMDKRIPCLRLDGSMSSKKRDQAVNEFHKDPELGVFLISIKAGGTGLNLTAADYIIILDPWWNPAVENQAIDRSHRIGQFNNVTAYRLISVDTVEEKVMELQKQKNDLVQGLLSGSASPLSAMKAEDILGLF